MSAGRQRPAVVVSRVHMEQIDAHLVGKAAKEVAVDAVQTKKKKNPRIAWQCRLSYVRVLRGQKTLMRA